METLDVTQLEPRLKHPTIFKRFDALVKGEELIIENDHDPKPLYYQLMGERGPVFDWQYLEEGPLQWRVKITKGSTTDNEPSIGEIVASDWRKAEVLKRYGIDFCCGGKRTVREACEKSQLDYVRINKELKEIDASSSQVHHFNTWELDFLVDYIVNNHHQYVSKSIPFLYEIANKVAQVHGENHPELEKINYHVQVVVQELSQHMRKEELILFPYIKELVKAKRHNTPLSPAPFGSIANPIHMMEEEHTSAGDDLKAIESLSNYFTPPTDACNSYQILFLKLKEFQQDLFQHIHLENNILFPKALVLEQELL